MDREPQNRRLPGNPLRAAVLEEPEFHRVRIRTYRAALAEQRVQQAEAHVERASVHTVRVEVGEPGVLRLDPQPPGHARGCGAQAAEDLATAAVRQGAFGVRGGHRGEGRDVQRADPEAALHHEDLASPFRGIDAGRQGGAVAEVERVERVERAG
ncbi:hypothetical protein AB0D04_23630 [Streptomyces sp. NPDC048483]|uniref:hypothetical protein n=1 Tax=Streptomyces sp. NPDC048483 TaxID=3154927 RepID=UPI0034140A71